MGSAGYHVGASLALRTGAILLATESRAASAVLPSGDAPVAQPIPRLQIPELDKCIQCGFCLQHCPTYRLTGLETESPRGRIHLAEAAAQGRIPIDSRFEEHMYVCLGCRACETACPAGVRFGTIIEAARAEIGPTGSLGALARSLHLIPKRLAEMETLLPPIPDRFFASPQETLPAIGPRRARVGLLSGCVMSVMFADLNDATIRVLRRNGCDVVVPRAQTCCAALNLHNGERERAREMARRNIDAFLQADVDAVVINAAGCGSASKEYDILLRDDPAYAEKAKRYSHLCKDVTEFLSGLGLVGALGEVPARVTYQDPCHLVHGQGIRRQPRDLLRQIPGLELVEMEGSDRCCGSAGVYNLIQPEYSRHFLDEKMEAVGRTGADLVVAPNPGCMLQIAAGVRARGLRMHVHHLIDLLDRSYTSADGRSRGETPGG